MKIIPLDKAKSLGVDFVPLAAGRAAISDATARLVANRPPRGLGDVLAAVFKATGAAKLAKAYERVTGKPCGCAQRQAALNKAVPF